MNPQVNVPGETVCAAFIGNPNCGKTTLFNAYTGAKLKVANWPGVTVEKKEGAFKFHGEDFKLVDLPGIYSLTSYTMEEKLSRQYILEDEVDVIVDVADASSLERNLYLTLQLIELGKPVVLALNMMDIVEERGMEIDMHRLPEMLGIPVIPVSARKRSGLDILMHAAAHHKSKTGSDKIEHHHRHSPMHKHDHSGLTIVYSDEIEDKIDAVSERLAAEYDQSEIPNFRWVAMKLLEHDEEIEKRYSKVPVRNIASKSFEEEIIRQKYDFIEEVISECIMNKSQKAERTDEIDSVFTHKIWGLPIFLGIMALVFVLTFILGDFLKGGLEYILGIFSDTVYSSLETVGAAEWLISLIVDGIIAGVGGILTFLPNIFILFLALAFLEDSGYMSRVAYVMDGLMGSLGLSGRAFIPMLLGFGCTVPAIMASRTLEDPKDRLKTIFITPFMSCSARLPVYVLLSNMFFGKYAMIAAFSMYVIGMAAAIVTAKIIHIFEKKRDIKALLIELPEYKSPNARTIFIYVWEKLKDYLTKAGTVIFIASVIIWFVLNFGMNGMVEDMSDSFGASIGKIIAPVLSTAGLGAWQIAVALISGIAAKEIVVSSMSVLYGIGNIASAGGMAELSAALGAGSFGAEGFGSLNAFAMMTFCLLYVPCAATIATIKNETKSVKWTVAAIVFQLSAAWIVSTLIYQIGRLIKL